MEYPQVEFTTKHGKIRIEVQSATEAHVSSLEPLSINGIAHTLSAYVEMEYPSGNLRVKHLNLPRDQPITERKETTRNAISIAYDLSQEFAAKAFTKERIDLAIRTQYVRELESAEAKLHSLLEKQKRWNARAQELRVASLMPDDAMPRLCTAKRRPYDSDKCFLPEGHSASLPHTWDKYQWD